MKKKYAFLSFLIPFCLFLLLGILLAWSPFGEKNVLLSDLQGQYIALISYYKNLFNDPSSLLYSFHKGLGGGMFGTFCYYLASPFNLFFFLIPQSFLPQAIFFLIAIKIGLCGFCMYQFLTSHNAEKYKTAFLFSCCYALSAYVINYYFNIIWLDGVFLAPLILMGIDKIFQQKSGLPYCICLFLAIFSNYYIGFMLCIMAGLYFLYRFWLSYEKQKESKTILKTILSFLIPSFLAVLLCAIILVPTLLELQQSSKAFGTFTTKDRNWIWNPFQLFCKFLIGTHDPLNVVLNQSPHIYIGLFCLPCLLLYWKRKKGTKREKLASVIMFVIFIASFCIPYLDMIWHGFNFPIGFRYRYSFLFQLMCIYFAYQGFCQLEQYPKSLYIRFFLIYVISIFITMCFHYTILNYLSILISIVLMGIYGIILYLWKTDKDLKRQHTLSLLLGLLVFSELFVNAYLSLYQQDFSYQNEYLGYANQVNDELQKWNAKESDFYRIEKDIYYTLMDPFFCNFNGVTTFVSTVSPNLVNFFMNNGFVTWSNNIQYGSGTTPIIDSLLGIKYVLLQRDHQMYYQKKDQFLFSSLSDMFYDMKKKEVVIYENLNALKLGYMVSDRTKSFGKEFIENKNYNQFEYQNLLLQTMTNMNVSYLLPLSVTELDTNLYEIDVATTVDFMILIPFKSDPSFQYQIWIDNDLVQSGNIGKFGIFRVENKYAGKKVTLKVTSSDNVEVVTNPFVYYLNEPEYEKAIHLLKQNELEITKRTANQIEGNILSTEAKNVLYTSIPYEKGWSVYVDGKKEVPEKLFDSFLSVTLEPGNHHIKFRYQPIGLTFGVLGSIAGLIVSMLYFIWEKKWLQWFSKLYTKYEEIILYLIGGVFTTFVSLTSYLLFTKLFHFNYMTSSIISWILAVLFAYMINKKVVFKSISATKKEIYKEGIKFIEVRLASLGIDLFCMFLFVSVLHINDVLAKILNQVIIVIVNYIFSKLFVFVKKK